MPTIRKPNIITRYDGAMNFDYQPNSLGGWSAEIVLNGRKYEAREPLEESAVLLLLKTLASFASANRSNYVIKRCTNGGNVPEAAIKQWTRLSGPDATFS